MRRLTGVHVTDTSSGYRAMRAEVTETVRQTQVQYQTSELLIGAIAQGYRIAERPIVMRKRMAGESKKGHNLIYGFRYCPRDPPHLVARARHAARGRAVSSAAHRRAAARRSPPPPAARGRLSRRSARSCRWPSSP